QYAMPFGLLQMKKKGFLSIVLREISHLLLSLVTPYYNVILVKLLFSWVNIDVFPIFMVFTPCFKASKQFSNFGSMPSAMMPCSNSSLYNLESMCFITEFLSLMSFNTPFNSKQ